MARNRGEILKTKTVRDDCSAKKQLIKFEIIFDGFINIFRFTIKSF